MARHEIVIETALTADDLRATDVLDPRQLRLLLLAQLGPACHQLAQFDLFGPRRLVETQFVAGAGEVADDTDADRIGLGVRAAEPGERADTCHQVRSRALCTG